ncbi:MAG: prepilin-type N-terminal cleavage/methylation domain-containing protein [Candidatus Nomurabacteria bacterium]|jgi:prepilin-type N-terminal cleavage/methylation domain-containing protein|nr:prepilin-type N-terminal cleavage/methylation domain-containing protein [Candidatus Nomurabacteria bacterium]
MKKLIFHSKQRGDTLIEVLIAITVLGIVVSGVMSIMNRNYVSILNSAERTAVRAEMNSQAELLHYVHSQDSATWEDIKKLAVSDDKNGNINITTRYAITTGNITTPTAGSFYMNDRDDISNVKIETGLENNDDSGDGCNPNNRATSGNGIWIDAVKYTGDSSGKAYYDFYIKACWTPLGSLPQSQSSTIVRIYDAE